MRRLARAALRALAPATFLRRAAPDDRELGEAGERLAARWLRRAGWRVLARRLATPWAELDLVCVRAGVLACVEVKTARVAALPRRRGARPGADPTPSPRPGRRLDGASLARQRRAAAWLAARLAAELGVPLAPRVDLVEVLLEPPGPRVLHTPGLERPLAR